MCPFSPGTRSLSERHASNTGVRGWRERASGVFFRVHVNGWAEKVAAAWALGKRVCHMKVMPQITCSPQEWLSLKWKLISSILNVGFPSAARVYLPFSQLLKGLVHFCYLFHHSSLVLLFKTLFDCKPLKTKLCPITRRGPGILDAWRWTEEPGVQGIHLAFVECKYLHLQYFLGDFCSHCTRTGVNRIMFVPLTAMRENAEKFNSSIHSVQHWLLFQNS